MKILVFSPHPDDDLIGCGGSIAKHINNKNEVTTVYMTSGGAGSSKYSKEELVRIREGEAKEAAKIIGVQRLIFLRNEDGYLKYNRNILLKVIHIIRNEKPDLAYIPHQDDGHSDHKETNKIVAEAIERTGCSCFQECKGKPWTVNKLLSYEIWTPLQKISYVEDISDFMQMKLNALECHKSQMEEMNYKDAVKSLNRYRGIISGEGKYAECFQVLKTSRI
jgi:N-acetylglucosamine malate deacetylase 1